MKQVARVTVRDLEDQHRLLDRMIKKLNHRGQHMTPVERFQATELKKLRLVAKDQLLQQRRS
jgi:uncharacterized protein YdcH (DUF465 family)